MSPETTRLFLARRAPLKGFGWAVAASLATAGCAAAQTMPHPIILGSPAHISGTGPEMTTGFSAPAMEEHALHLLVGHSIFVNTKHRLSRVYVTNPTVLDSYTANPNQIVITAKASGVSTLIVWDEDGDSQVYTVSSDVDVENLRQALLQAMPKQTFDVKASEGRVVLGGTVPTQAVADNAVKIAGLYAKDISNALIVNSSKVPQVRLKVRFVEVDRSRLTQFGFSFFSTAGNNFLSSSTLQFPNTLTASQGTSGGSGSSFGLKSTTVSVSNPLNFMLYNADINVGVALQDLQNKQLLQILAEPNITTMSGQKANFLAGGEFPFPVVQGASAGFTSVSIQFRPFGVKLDFTPLVNPDGTIDLTIAPEVSALDYTNAVTIRGYTVPALSTKRAQTEVVLRSGQSFALSGLLDRRTTDSFQRTPGIASVPILGAFFRSKSLNHSLSELIVIVTPEIIDPLTMTEAPQEPKMVIQPINPQQFDPSMLKQELKEKINQ